jgi:hypothetical protein
MDSSEVGLLVLIFAIVFGGTVVPDLLRLLIGRGRIRSNHRAKWLRIMVRVLCTLYMVIQGYILGMPIWILVLILGFLGLSCVLTLLAYA